MDEIKCMETKGKSSRVSSRVSKQYRSRANVKIFAVKMCNANSEMWLLFCRIRVLDLGIIYGLFEETSSKINPTSGEVWNSVPDVKLAVLLFCAVSTSLSTATQRSAWMCRVLAFHCAAKLQMSAYVSIGWWEDSGWTRGCGTCSLNPEHLFGLCSRELQGNLERLHSSRWDWHGLAPRTPVESVRTETPDPWATEGAEKADSRDTFDHPPTPGSLVYGCRGYARYTALAGIWKPCITARLFTWP